MRPIVSFLTTRPSTRRSPRLTAAAPAGWRLPSAWSLLRALASGLLFLAAWALLNVMFNLRYPARVEEPAWWYLLPSLDATALLATFALLGWLRRELPGWVTGLLALLVIGVRLFRVADGLIQQNYFRNLHLSLDVPLLPELARLLHSTVPLPRLILGAAGLLLALTLLLLLVNGALRCAQRFLAAGPTHRGFMLGLAGGLAALAPLWPAEQQPELHQGLYGRSVVPLLAEQARLVAEAPRERLAKARQIAAAQRRLAQTPAGLEKLGGADVLFFLIESYGASVFRNTLHFASLAPAYESFSESLAQLGFVSASNSLESATYGGASWLAHATLASGVRIGDGRDYAVLRQTEPAPQTMAGFFRRAGYRTVLVQPGTTRPFPEGEVRGFSAKYYAPDLAYQGPAFGWATMPDQYVLDFVFRREVLPARAPLFIQYALVSSHAPWAVQPSLVDDWSDLPGGRIFHDLPVRRYPVSWGNISEGGKAYVDSLIYDLEVLRRYLGHAVTRPTLIIVMGDHQPPVVAAPDPSWDVPVHVISRDRALIERFTEIGFVPGMVPPGGGSSEKMETFLGTLLERLSSPAAGAGPSASRL